jgi:hypothetical protein
METMATKKAFQTDDLLRNIHRYVCASLASVAVLGSVIGRSGK